MWANSRIVFVGPIFCWFGSIFLKVNPQSWWFSPIFVGRILVFVGLLVSCMFCAQIPMFGGSTTGFNSGFFWTLGLLQCNQLTRATPSMVLRVSVTTTNWESGPDRKRNISLGSTKTQNNLWIRGTTVQFTFIFDYFGINITVSNYRFLTGAQVEPRKLININAFSLDRVLEMDPQFMDTEGGGVFGAGWIWRFLEFLDSWWLMTFRYFQEVRKQGRIWARKLEVGSTVADLVTGAR